MPREVQGGGQAVSKVAKDEGWVPPGYPQSTNIPEGKEVPYRTHSSAEGVAFSYAEWSPLCKLGDAVFQETVSSNPRCDARAIC